MWVNREGELIGRAPCSDDFELFAPVLRFTPARKLALVNAVKRGTVSLPEVLAYYGVSHDEWLSWARDAERGLEGLRVSRRSKLAIELTPPRGYRKATMILVA